MQNYLRLVVNALNLCNNCATFNEKLCRIYAKLNAKVCQIYCKFNTKINRYTPKKAKLCKINGECVEFM